VADESLPDGAYEAADAAFEGWRGAVEHATGEWKALRGSPFPGCDELEAALLAAAPLIRAAERDRIRKLAERNGAVCTGDEGTQCYFADLIRGEVESNG